MRRAVRKKTDNQVCRQARSPERQTEANRTTTKMMTMMKNPVILMACIFLLSSLVTSDNTFGPDKCCFKFIHRRVAKNKVMNFEYTDKRCAMEGVLLTMPNGKQICADLSAQWVKDTIEWVQTKNATSSGPEGSA